MDLIDSSRVQNRIIPKSSQHFIKTQINLNASEHESVAHEIQSLFHKGVIDEVLTFGPDAFYSPILLAHFILNNSPKLYIGRVAFQF